MTFCYVSYLKSLQKVSFVIIQIKEVEDMFDIFYRVDVPVNIYIMIIGVNGSHQLGILAHFHSRTCLDRTRFFRINIFFDEPVVNFKNINRLSGLRINHCPHALAVTVNLGFFR
ncbi:Uncharacterised protein [Segatella copri]|nr:Uncharacterised protein [Segatella copri]